MKIRNIYRYSTFLLAMNVQAETQTIGATYAIVEPDALEEIRQSAAGVNWQEKLRDTLRYSGIQAHRLPEATEDRTRIFTPIYTTPFDVTDKDGNLVYPEGFEYNVLAHVHLPMRIMIFSNQQHHLEWVRQNRKESDILILSGSGLDEVMKNLEHPVFLLSDRIVMRLGLETVPTIVEQENDHFLIQEFNLESTDD